jgi:hypothetical protein
VIKDFEDGIDIIDLSPLPLGFADLEIADLGGSAMIDFQGNQIVLEGVPVSLVDPSDFLFGTIA